MRKKKGFTLIELLVVIGIISILTGIVIIAVNPARQTAMARNAKRRADVLTYLNAIHQYFIDTGSWPNGLDTNAKMIGNDSGSACNVVCNSGDLGIITAGCVGDDFINSLIPTYITGLAFDPLANPATTNVVTKYAVKKDAENRITVGACNTEPVGAITNISVTR